MKGPAELYKIAAFIEPKAYRAFADYELSWDGYDGDFGLFWFGDY